MLEIITGDFLKPRLKWKCNRPLTKSQLNNHFKICFKSIKLSNLSISNLFKAMYCFNSAHCHCGFTEGTDGNHCQSDESNWRPVSVIRSMQGVPAGRWVQDRDEFLVGASEAFGLMAFAGTSSGRHPWTETFWPNESPPSQRGRGSPVRLAVNPASVSCSLRPQKDMRFQVATWFHFSIVKMMEIAAIFQSASLANGDWCFPPAWNC